MPAVPSSLPVMPSSTRPFQPTAWPPHGACGCRTLSCGGRAHLDEGFLADVFEEIGDWVYEACGLQLPPEARKFEVFTNKRGTRSGQGRVGYRGPLGKQGDPPRIKLDLAADEVLVLSPVQRPVHHPYTDVPS